MMSSADNKRQLTLSCSHTLAKSTDYPNEDHWAVDQERQIFVVSDGASISYDSALWSRILAEHFLESPELDEEWLAVARQKFATFHNTADLPWNKQAAFDRGSFATILGLSYDQTSGKAKVQAVGDSVLVAIDETGNWLTSFPYEDAADFRQDPVLVSTRRDAELSLNETTQPLHLAEHIGTVTLLLMTDAVGAWCLERGAAGAAELAQLQESCDFETFVRTEQTAQRMRVDDATLMVINLGPCS